MDNAEQDDFEPLTDMQLDQTTILAGLGLDLEDISVSVGVDPKSLASNTDAQTRLRRGQALARFKVAQAAFHQARSGRSVLSTIIWLKTVAGWTETRPVMKDSPVKTKKRVEFYTKVGERGELITSQTEV